MAQLPGPAGPAGPAGRAIGEAWPWLPGWKRLHFGAGRGGVGGACAGAGRVVKIWLREVCCVEFESECARVVPADGSFPFQ